MTEPGQPRIRMSGAQLSASGATIHGNYFLDWDEYDTFIPARDGHVRGEWRYLTHELRTYARHAPACAYQPTHPESAPATCNCGFDAVLDRYDRLSAE